MSDNPFTILDLYNTVPKYILDELTEDVDILEDADEEFLLLVADLELMTDLKKRAALAKTFIDKHPGYLKEISYKELGPYLVSPGFLTIYTWCQLYVLERSITPRFGDKYTWFDRLVIFYNTYLHEANLDGKSFIYDGKKYTLHLKRGNETTPIYHDKLVYGRGEAKSDFYIYDDRLPGDKPAQKMVDVEYKYCDEATIEAGAKKYSTGQYTYKARYLILFMAKFNAYYLIDYLKYPNEGCFMKLDIVPPTNTIAL